MIQYRALTRRLSVYSRVFRSSIDHPEEFWSEQAEKIAWFDKWSHVLDKNDPIRPRWFHNGRLNMA
jgi:propionyl-CoA synthetase